MIAVISPAKSIDFSKSSVQKKLSSPQFASIANELVEELRMFSVEQLVELYKVSPKIAHLNFTRFQDWQVMPNSNHIKSALLAFTGEVYRGIDATTLNSNQLSRANDSIRILSGLYGVLKPLDGIQPYRLEMGTKIGIHGHTSLYQWWSERVTSEINKTINESKGDKLLINLASNEYFKVIDKRQLKYPVLTIDFKQQENGKLKNITVYAKKARGFMARFIIDNSIRKKEHLKAFDIEGYCFSPEYSSDNKWVFAR